MSAAPATHPGPAWPGTRRAVVLGHGEGRLDRALVRAPPVRSLGVEASGDLVTSPSTITLVAPALRYRDTFLRAAREFQQEGLPWWIGGDLEIAERDFGAFVAKRLADAQRRTEILVPKTHLWAIDGDEMVGRIAIHHELNPALRLEGGHIGYDTVPSQRGRGIATEMLRQALPIARGLGLTEVLLTCNDDNQGSIRVIERNGGVLRETKAPAPGRPLKRYYWISLVTER